jgi:hypothetical protein
MHTATSPLNIERAADIRAGRKIEYLSIAWTSLEAVIGVVAGLLAGSVALIGFGIDSLIEVASSGVLLWRLSDQPHAEERERGFYLLMILFSLPFVSPIPLPALSNVFGVAVMVISFRLAWRLPPRLPSFLAKREIPRERIEAFLRKAGSALQGIEKLVKPRVGNWMAWPPAQFANAMALALMGFLLAIPLPPVLPFSHSLPCWSIIIIALAMMERDGVLIWFGYVVGLGTFVYMVFFTSVVAIGIHRIFNSLH